MENGAAVADELHTDEVKDIQVGFWTPKAEENVVAAGLHRSKPSEGDDVFEEAIEGGFLEDDDAAAASVNSDSDGIAGGDDLGYLGFAKSYDQDHEGDVADVPARDGVQAPEQGIAEVKEALPSRRTTDAALVGEQGGCMGGNDGGHARIGSNYLDLLDDGGVAENVGSFCVNSKGDEEEAVVEEFEIRGDTTSGEDRVKEFVASPGIDLSREDQGPSCVDCTVDTSEAPVEEPKVSVNSEFVDHGETQVSKDTSYFNGSNGPAYADDNSEPVTYGENHVLNDVGEESVQVSRGVQQSENCSSLKKDHDSVVVQTCQPDGPLIDRHLEAHALKDADIVDAYQVGDSTKQLEDSLKAISSVDQSHMVEGFKESLGGEKRGDEVLQQKGLASQHWVDDDGNFPESQDENVLDHSFVDVICQKLEAASVAGGQIDSTEVLETALASIEKTTETIGEGKESGMALGSVYSGLLDQGSKLEGSASYSNSSVDNGRFTSELETLTQDSVVEKDAKLETVASESRKENVSTRAHQSASDNADNIRDYHIIEEQVYDREIVDGRGRNVQSIREVEVYAPASTGPSTAGPATSVTLPVCPAGLGHGAPLLETPPRVTQQSRSNGSVGQVQAQLVEEAADGEAEEADDTREKLQMIRVKFLRLAHRLGQTPHNVVVAQVLYRLGLAEQLRSRSGGRVGAFTFDRASAMAEQLEATGQEPLDFSCTIMVLGKTGVGKSATINSIFDEVKFGTNAFQVGTKSVQDVVGTVHGIKVRVIDTPGLLSSWSDQHQNMKTLHSVKRFIRKTPPDIVLYLDRLDTQSRDLGDMPLLRTITEVFGPSIWFNAIVVLTHAASAPPEGPNGTTSTYDVFVTQRSHAVQQAIRQAAGDIRLMNPVSLVENHSACRTNRAGQRVLPNGQVWKPHLLLLSFASKILAEANELLKLQDGPSGKPFASRSRTPPLPVLLSSLLQSRPQLKLPEEQFSDDDAADDDLDESSDSDDEYEALPPFRRLTKAELAKLSKDEKNAYYSELEYREKIFMKKQLKDEKKRRKVMKQMAELAKDFPGQSSENAAEENGAATSVPVAMPDLALPVSFDSDNPVYRYRCLDNSNPWLVRPVLEPAGWDHDVGYEGVNVERVFAIKEKIPLSFSGQVSKDKKDINVQVEVASSMKHGEGKYTMLGLDMQSAGKDMLYTLRSETRFHNHQRNKATAAVSVTSLGDILTAGMKIEDKLTVSKRLRVVMSGGALTGRADVAYGGSLEATLRDKDYPLGRSLTSLGLSVMDWHGELATGFNLQSQIPIGRSTNLVGRVNLNNKGNGQVSIRLNSSEQLQLVLVGLIPLIRKLLAQPEQYY